MRSVTLSAPGAPNADFNVDGAPVEVPATFNWPLGSSHVISTAQEVPVSGNTELKFETWTRSLNSTDSSVSFTVSSNMTLTAGYPQRFLTQIRFADTNGAVVHPDSVTLAGQTGTIVVPGSREVWLPGTKNYSLISATWEGSQLAGAPPFTQISVTGPGTVSVTVPVYDEVIHVDDVFGKTIAGAQVSLTLIDGTTQTATTGPNGSASFSQVPRGPLHLSVDYLGVSSSFAVDASKQPLYSVTIARSYPVGALVGLGLGTVASVFVLRRKPSQFNGPSEASLSGIPLLGHAGFIVAGLYTLGCNRVRVERVILGTKAPSDVLFFKITDVALETINAGPAGFRPASGRQSRMCQLSQASTRSEL